MGERKTAIVTGGSRGIGRAIAVELAACGYDIVITYKSNEAAAEETLRLIREAGGGAGERAPRPPGTGRRPDQ
jgi:3-oxoacyl-[acyl-carrier protein] reductase